MSLFDNMPGRKRSKVKLPRAAKLAASEADQQPLPAEEAVAEAESVPVVDGTSAAVVAVEATDSAPEEPSELPAAGGAPVAFPEPAVEVASASESEPEPEPASETPVVPEPEVPAEPEAEPELPPAIAPEPELPATPVPGPEVPAEPAPEPEIAPLPEPAPEAGPEPVELSAESEPNAAVEPVAAPAHDTLTEPVVAPEAPVHEKVEGIDDIADVVVPVAAAAAAGGIFKPKKPKKSVGLPKRKIKEPKLAKEAKEPKVREPKVAKRHGSVTKGGEVVGLGGSRRAVKAKEPRAKADRPVRQKPERRRVAILAGFRDPVRRPRYILWTGAAVLGLAAVMIVALGITSTRWFCSEACHKVQDDTITAYQHSSHSEISCMACHMPVGSSPVVFILHKAEALGELYLTVTDNYELPLNGESEVALTMESKQCTQCHDIEKRKVTPAQGLKIDHKAHEEKGVECAVCHNRIAHNEDFELVLNDPKTGEQNQKHENFMAMTACFRCHTQNATAPGPVKAPGQCIACHPAGYETKKPKSHLEPGFFPKGHGDLGREAAAAAASATAEAKAEGEAGHGDTKELGPSLPKVESINECSTCHSDKFCSDCHGNVIMPHPADFKKNHGTTGKKNPQSCAKCHGSADRFCDECHHKTSIKRTYDKSKTWFQQHPAAVGDVGATACFKCHEPTYCARCHTRGTVTQ